MIISIVDRKRYGLLEHAEALNYYYTNATSKPALLLKHSSLESEFGIEYSILNLFKQLYINKPKNCVVWSVGITYIFLPILSIIFRNTRFIVVMHEPGGFEQRISKGDPLIYSILTSCYELVLKFSKVFLVTPNINNSKKFQLYFAPLLFISRFNEDAYSTRKSIIFLGRKSTNRCYELFFGENLSNFKNQIMGRYSFSIFPANGLFRTEDKCLLMKNALCVLNMYLVDHNQSGVTPDSLSFGVPVIVTEKDAFSKLISEYNAGIVLNSNDVNHSAVLIAINEIFSKLNFYRSGAKELFSEEFGKKAFFSHWLSILK